MSRLTSMIREIAERPSSWLKPPTRPATQLTPRSQASTGDLARGFETLVASPSLAPSKVCKLIWDRLTRALPRQHANRRSSKFQSGPFRRVYGRDRPQGRVSDVGDDVVPLGGADKGLRVGIRRGEVVVDCGLQFDDQRRSWTRFPREAEVVGSRPRRYTRVGHGGAVTVICTPCALSLQLSRSTRKPNLAR
jgi:hypothetical protein